jgi:hypothetical protein
MLRGFEFPPASSLPEDIRDLPRKQAIDASTMKRLDGTIKELESFLVSWPIRFFLKRIGFGILNMLVVIIFCVVAFARISSNNMQSNEYKCDVDFVKEVELMLESKEHEMPGFLKKEWNSMLGRIEETEGKLDSIDINLELKRVEIAYDAGIKKETPRFLLQNVENNEEYKP